ncbi:MAG: M3 family oligoendopeptidase [Acholeplasmataceae bacterium]
MNTWDLSGLYEGFDQRYEKDLTALDRAMDDYKSFIANEEGRDDVTLIEGYLSRREDIIQRVMTLGSYARLTWATNVNDQVAPVYLAKIQRIMQKATAEDVRFSRHLAMLDLSELAEKSASIATYSYILKREQKQAKHLLSEKEEVLYARMRELASGSWSDLQGLLTANLSVRYRDRTMTLSEVRNLAYDHDSAVRKDAYEAEIKAYEGIDDAVALALSNIKREVKTLDDFRGYKSTLDKTLFQSRLDRDALDAMLRTMEDYRHHFARYLQAKARYLGHEGSLPFYDLFAPVGKIEKTYSYEEAQDIIKRAFAGFSDKLKAFAQKAFDRKWIDLEPRKGKRGGAFCSNQPQIKESRILTNFTGSLSDVLTLSHELGHGYHGDVISNNGPLHWSYPMPLAETASIFCETIVNEHLLETIDDPKATMAILENALQGDTQVIIDILSRFYFETDVFRHADGPIPKNRLKDMMVQAQKKAYGDGLDHDYLHPYMWLNKPHYYSAGLNFYNFPYAFGLLFAKGLYAEYRKDKKRFISAYDDLLAMTTKADVKDVAKTMGIDVTKKDFWSSSLELIRRDIDRTIDLLKRNG